MPDPSIAVQRCCGTCGESGALNGALRCQWVQKRWSESLPEWIELSVETVPVVHPTDGTNCPTWKAREKEGSNG